jgi:hypothetical protein
MKKVGIVLMLLAGLLLGCEAPGVTDPCGPVSVDTVETQAGPMVVSMQLCLTPPPIGP